MKNKLEIKAASKKLYRYFENCEKTLDNKIKDESLQAELKSNHFIFLSMYFFFFFFRMKVFIIQNTEK